MEKKKYEVTIAGVEMAIISDEREEFVQKLVSQLDSQITDITIRNKRCSKMDAAILVALEQSGDRLKAEKRVRNLEAQIALYDANLRRMREENIKLKEAMLGGKNEMPAEEQDALDSEAALESPAEEAEEGELQLTIDAEPEAVEEKPVETREDKIRRIAELMHKKDGEAPKEKSSKLAEIESLLRNKN